MCADYYQENQTEKWCQLIGDFLKKVEKRLQEWALFPWDNGLSSHSTRLGL